LKKFYLEYDEYIDDDFVFPTYPGELNQFTSSFWIERRWLLETEIEYEYIKYFIRPYKYIEKSLSYKIECLVFFRKRWYEYTDDNIVNSSTELSKSARLNIEDIPSVESYESIMKHIKRILSIAKIYHLEISQPQIFIDLLIRIINFLPELHSLKIHSLSYNESNNFGTEELKCICLTLLTRKITKVYVEQMIILEEMLFLMALFPSTVYFKVDFICNMNIESCLRNILAEIDHECGDHLRSLCFRVQAADDQTIKTLQKTIHDEKLLINYTIKRVVDNIYLQWT
jgi:hypothetical protein